MCGMVGIFSNDGVDASDERRLEHALDLITHRGPDSSVITNIPTFGAVGFARLAINDVQEGGQPFATSDGRYLTWVNGEIYNADEIRTTLRKVGVSFSSRSDCESAAHLASRGPQLLNELEGMFALATFDRGSGVLTLARDRFGQKPLYYTQDGTHTYFASELSALLALNPALTHVEAKSLASYFYYDWAPESLSPIAGVAEVPADSALTFRVRVNSAPTEHRHLPRSNSSNASNLGQAFEASVGSMLSSDVSIGVALSAGVDSSLIASTAQSLSSTKIHSFTIAFEGLGQSGEAPLAARTAQSLGLVHHEVQLSNSLVVEEFPRYAMAMDEPIADMAGLAYRALMETARAHDVPVLLFGHGADELMWGYPWVADRAVCYLRQEGRWHSSDDVRRLLQLLRHTSSRRQAVRGLKATLANFRPVQRSCSVESADFYGGRPDYLSALMSGHSVPLLRPAPEHFSAQPVEHDLESAIVQPLLRGYLRENGLTQLDRLSMLSSVEVRLPYLGDPFVDFVLSPGFLASGLRVPGKLPLRRVARGRIPDAVFNQPKRGFAPPSQTWLRDILGRWGQELVGGRLVQTGVLSDSDLQQFLAWKDESVSIHPLWYRALLLEFWWRGREESLGRSLELSAQ